MLVICDNSTLSALAEIGLIDFEETLASLLATGFRLAPALIEQARLKAAL